MVRIIEANDKNIEFRRVCTWEIVDTKADALLFTTDDFNNGFAHFKRLTNANKRRPI